MYRGAEFNFINKYCAPNFKACRSIVDNEYQEIKIIGVDKDSIKVSADKKGMWVVAFKLSQKPDSDWVRKFCEVEEKNSDLMKRSGVISNASFEVNVFENDDLQVVLEVLKKEVAETNAQCSEDYQKKLKIRQEIEDLRQKENDAKQKFKDNADELNF